MTVICCTESSREVDVDVNIVFVILSAFVVSITEG